MKLTTPEARLLIHCARPKVEPDRALAISQLVEGNLNWDSLLKLADRNGLLQLLYFHLSAICAESIPPERYKYLQDFTRQTAAFNLILTGELLGLLKAFEQEGVSALPYKGPATASSVYGNLSLRQFSDLDILVREADIWRATEILVTRGFEPHLVIPENKRLRFVRLSYVRLFRRDGGHLIVELHWKIAPRFFGVEFDADGLWRRLKTMELRGATVLTPSSEDQLIMLAVHGGKDCWEKAEWCAAIAELIRKTPGLNWRVLLQQAELMHCRRIVLLGLLLAQELFEVPLPLEIQTRLSQERKLATLADKIVEGFFCNESESVTLLRRISFHLALKDRWSEKIRHCVRLALTTTPLDWAELSLPESLSFVYSLIRPFRLLRKYSSGPRAARH